MAPLLVLNKLATTAASMIVLAMALSSSVQAASLTNGPLTVDIDDTSGAINSAALGGVEFYQEGSFVSDFGFQNGTDASTFQVNTVRSTFAGLPPSIPVSVTPGSGFITVNGTYQGGGASISFNRVYSLIPGLNVLRTVTTFLNSSTTDTTLSFFETFDPDQGVDRVGSGAFSTFNDVIDLPTGAGTARVGQASESTGFSVVIGSLQPEVTVASGGPFSISSSAELESFFAAPVDGNGVFVDAGTHIGLRSLLAAGKSLSFTVDQAFGTTTAEAQGAFAAANPIPTPALLPGLIGLGVKTLRRRKQLANR